MITPLTKTMTFHVSQQLTLKRMNLAPRAHIITQRVEKQFPKVDFNLGEEACALLMKNPSLDASEIILSVHGESLTLRGVVKSEAEKIEAEHCLKSITEVSTVINELQIRR
jgi:osmotically-inducible protein OsmY